jgi:hypothetical protein
VWCGKVGEREAGQWKLGQSNVRYGRVKQQSRTWIFDSYTPITTRSSHFPQRDRLHHTALCAEYRLKNVRNKIKIKRILKLFQSNNKIRIVLNGKYKTLFNNP